MDLKTQLFKQHELNSIKRSTVSKKELLERLPGKTTIKPINNVRELINQADIKPVDTVTSANEIAKEVVNMVQEDIMPSIKSAKAPAQNAPTYEFGESIKYREGIEETLKNAGIDYDAALIDRIYIEIMKANVNPNAPIKLSTHTTISDVTQLIDINLTGTVPEDVLNISIVTNLIDKLLAAPTSEEEYSTDAEVRQFILDKANELRTPAAPDPEEPVGQVNVDAFFNKGDGTELTVFQIYDNRYYNGEDQVAKTINNAFVSVAKERGIYYDLTEYKNFIAETIKNIHNSADVENTDPPVLKKEALVKYFESHTLEDLVKLIGSNEPVNVTPTTGDEPNPTTGGGTEPTTNPNVGGNTEPTTNPNAGTGTEPTTNPNAGTGTEPTTNPTVGGDTEVTPPVTSNVNLDGLFKNGETLTAYQIYNDKYSYMYSDDEVAKEFITAINSVASKLGIQVRPTEYQNLVNVIIAQINDLCGDENGNPPVLAKATLNKYFSNHTMDDLKALITSPKTQNEYYQEALRALGLDDIFGEVNQNKKQGDCYFLSTLYSIANTPNGAALLADAFGTVEIDGVTHYTFTFKGGYRNKNKDESANNYCTKTTTYTFSPQQIMDALNSGKYSTGDINYLVAELAFEALMQDQVYGDNEPNTAFDNGYLANGTGVQVMFLLTGNNNTNYTSSGSEFKNFVMSLLRNGSIEEGTTGNYMMYLGFNGHAHAIVGASEEGVTYIDPYNSSQKLFMSWDTILNNPSIYKNFQWAYIPSSNDSQSQGYSDWYNW